MTTHFENELASQPDVWEQVAARAAELTADLPRRGETVAAVGCGTSWFMAQAYAARREALGQGRTDAFAASEFPLDRAYDRVVMITRSGTTSEVIAVMEALLERGAAHVAIVATAGTEVAERAEHCVLLDFADEQSVVQTRFATSALTLLRLSLGEDVAPVVAAARAVLGQSDEELFGGGLLEAGQITFVGRGLGVGVAHEAGLKLRESCQFWTESYPAMEYRHGPMAIAAPGRAVWSLGPLPSGLAEDIAATGALVVEHPDVDPLAELVRVHRYCLARVRQAGLDPDAPRNLTRSVVLAEAAG